MPQINENLGATIKAFSRSEIKSTKLYLAGLVSRMMGRKLEEGDWIGVYCSAKSIPKQGWSNLHIDVAHEGLGVEVKMLRATSHLRGGSIRSVCGTTMMHPSATRSIRISDIAASAMSVMHDVFDQYSELVERKRIWVQSQSGKKNADLRSGWLLWEDSLSEFLYFEERLHVPNASNYWAEWNETPARGARKASKSLWIYERGSNRKRYSVTTSAGIKIQPYFDVPSPSDKNLYYFRVQGEPVQNGRAVYLWVSADTARELKSKIGSLNSVDVERAIQRIAVDENRLSSIDVAEAEIGFPIRVSRETYSILCGLWNAVSDEHRARLLIKAL